MFDFLEELIRVYDEEITGQLTTRPNWTVLDNDKKRGWAVAKFLDLQAEEKRVKERMKKRVKQAESNLRKFAFFILFDLMFPKVPLVIALNSNSGREGKFLFFVTSCMKIFSRVLPPILGFTSEKYIFPFLSLTKSRLMKPLKPSFPRYFPTRIV